MDNVAPAAVLTGDTVQEGSSATVRFSDATDPSAADTAAGFRYEYDLDGDGTFEPGGASATVPTTNGPATIDVRAAILDRDGARREYATTVIVENAPPAASIDGPELVPSSGEVTLTVDASDSDVLTGELDWGDGHTEAFTGSGERELSHTYAAPGDYTVSLVVRDADGAESQPVRHTLSVATLQTPSTPETPPTTSVTPQPTPAAGGVAGATQTRLRISDVEVTPRCIRAANLRATAAGVRTLGVRFRLTTKAAVRFDLKPWTGKRGAADCPPVRGKAKADGRRVPGVYSTHSKRAVAARAGVNTVTLAATGRKGKLLRPGTYLLTVTSGTVTARTKVWVLAG